MKTELEFTVTIELNDPTCLTEGDCEEFTDNLLNAIVHEINRRGIVPENIPTFTKTVDVRCEETGFGVMKDLTLDF